jgi:agmatine/peptidylarginine deiminase
MSGKKVNELSENIDALRTEIDDRIVKFYKNDEVGITSDKEEGEPSYNELESMVEKLKSDVKSLKKIKKQQKKLSKLEEKKVEILREIDRGQDRERKTKDSHDRKKRK